MNTRIGLIAGIGLLLGIPAAQAHPDYTPGSCHVLARNKARDAINLNNGERLDFNAPLLRVGFTTITCEADLGAGTPMILNFANTGFTCDLGPEALPVAHTQDWTEVIKANGQTTLTCRFGPR